MRPFWQGALFCLAFFLGMFIGYSMGGTDKTAYVSDLAARCTAQGGVLTIRLDANTMYYDCNALAAPVEVQSDAVECAPEREVMNRLIREDYKRKVTGI